MLISAKSTSRVRNSCRPHVWVQVMVVQTTLFRISSACSQASPRLLQARHCLTVTANWLISVTPPMPPQISSSLPRCQFRGISRASFWMTQPTNSILLHHSLVRNTHHHSCRYRSATGPAARSLALCLMSMAYTMRWYHPLSLKILDSQAVFRPTC